MRDYIWFGGEIIPLKHILGLEEGKYKNIERYVLQVKYVSEYFLSQKDRYPIFVRTNYYDSKKARDARLNAIIKHWQPYAAKIEWLKQEGRDVKRHTNGWIVENITDVPSQPMHFYIYDEDIQQTA